MNLIPYEEFTINVNILKKLNEYYVSKKINEYYTQNGQLPDSGTVETFTIPEKLMDRYKKHFYAEYYRKEAEFEKEYGPSEMIETSFDFSTADDSESTLLGAKSPMLLGANTSGDDTEYQYEYWSIVIDGNNTHKIGQFTSLKNARIELYSLSKYRIYVYHRKSNYQYESITPGASINNRFSDYWWRLIEGHDISKYPPYKTQSEDKEYIGFIDNYVPTQGGSVKGNVYTLNPRILLNVSGLTNDVSFELNAYVGLEGYYGKSSITLMQYSGGTITLNESISGFTRTSDSSFSCVLNKDIVASILPIFIENGPSPFNDNNRIEEKSCGIPYDFGLRCFVGGEEKARIYPIGFDNILHRNDITTMNVIIPPLGTNIDTGFEFDTIDD